MIRLIVETDVTATRGISAEYTAVVFLRGTSSAATITVDLDLDAEAVITACRTMPSIAVMGATAMQVISALQPDVYFKEPLTAVTNRFATRARNVLLTGIIASPSIPLIAVVTTAMQGLCAAETGASLKRTWIEMTRQGAEMLGSQTWILMRRQLEGLLKRLLRVAACMLL